MPGENYCEAVAVGSGNVPNFDALKRANMAAGGLPATTSGSQMPSPPPPAPRPSGRGGTYAINPFRRRRPRSGGGRNMRRRQQPATTQTPTEVYEHARGSTWVPAKRTSAKTAPVSGGSSVPSSTSPSRPPAHLNHPKNGGTGTPRRNPVVGIFQATISVPKKVIGFLVIKPVTFVVGSSW